MDESHRLLQAHPGTTQARPRCKAFPPGFTGMPQCVTSCGTRTAYPGQPVSTLTAADLRPYRSKERRHKLVPDAVLTAFRHTEGKVPCRPSVQSRRPSRRIQVIVKIFLVTFVVLLAHHTCSASDQCADLTKDEITSFLAASRKYVGALPGHSVSIKSMRSDRNCIVDVVVQIGTNEKMYDLPAVILPDRRYTFHLGTLNNPIIASQPACSVQ